MAVLLGLMVGVGVELAANVLDGLSVAVGAKTGAFVWRHAARLNSTTNIASSWPRRTVIAKAASVFIMMDYSPVLQVITCLIRLLKLSF